MNTELIILISFLSFLVIGLIFVTYFYSSHNSDLRSKVYRKEIQIVDLKYDVERLKIELDHQKRDYNNLMYRKFTKVRIKDTFCVPDTDNWLRGFRGAKCIVIKINDNGITADNGEVDREGYLIHWSVRWDQLQHMVFLDNEPARPFELTV